MRLRNIDLLAAMCYVVATMGWALLANRPLIVGIVLAVPLVLILPGYTLAQLLPLRRGEPLWSPAPGHTPTSEEARRATIKARPYGAGVKMGQPFGAIDLMVFSLGLSLVIDVVTGFLLNLIPVGLQWQSWTLSLGLVTEVFTLLALLMRRRPGLGQPAQKKDTIARRLPLKEGALLGLALAVAALAVWLSITRPPQPQPFFTQFWMLPASAGKSCAVLIGVHSFEAGSESYQIEVTSNGKQVASWPSITLAAQQEWDHQLSVSPTPTGDTAVVDARLYRLDQPGTIYREVHVTLQSCGG